MGLSVPGGFQRLLSAFRSEKSPKTIVTFADRRWSQGKIYKTAGFKLDGVDPPTYWYTKYRNDRYRVQKSAYRRARIEKTLGPILEGETEEEAMYRFGFSRIYDCGRQRWILKIP